MDVPALLGLLVLFGKVSSASTVVEIVQTPSQVFQNVNTFIEPSINGLFKYPLI